MSMDCQRFEQMLEELLDGAVTATERREAEEHVSSCERCSELDGLVRDAGLALPDAPAELTRDVLQRTSGSPCAQAHELLCEQADDALRGVDAELLALHRNHCGGCRELETALLHLREDLPGLAQADPGPKFVQQVMAATLPLDRRLVRLGRRARGVWEQLTQRPRFAWEGGYIGALVLFLIFGMPGSPLSAVPGEALALAQINPMQVVQDSPLGEVPGTVAGWGKQAWNATGKRAFNSGSEFSAEMGVRLRNAGMVSHGFFAHSMELGEALLQGNLEQSLSVLKNMGGDLVVIWNRLVADVDKVTQEKTESNLD
jgi:hypothetical protein